MTTDQRPPEEDDDTRQLIDQLIQLRKRRGLTQRQLAERMGTTQAVVSLMERLRRRPRYSMLQRYARACDARINFRLEPENPMSTTETKP